jgi:hypothetical protein
MMKNAAVVNFSPEKYSVEVREIDKPSIGPDDVLLEVVNWPIWERVIALMASGQLDVRPIIGGIWPIDQWQVAFEKMHQGEVVKSVLKPA